MAEPRKQVQEDEVLRRMLKTPPTPFTPKKKAAAEPKPSRGKQKRSTVKVAKAKPQQA